MYIVFTCQMKGKKVLINVDRKITLLKSPTLIEIIMFGECCFMCLNDIHSCNNIAIIMFRCKKKGPYVVKEKKENS